QLLQLNPDPSLKPSALPAIKTIFDLDICFNLPDAAQLSPVKDPAEVTNLVRDITKYIADYDTIQKTFVVYMKLSGDEQLARAQRAWELFKSSGYQGNAGRKEIQQYLMTHTY